MGLGNITREFTVWCGKCVEWNQVSHNTQKDAVSMFKRMGWSKTSKFGWVCPTCKNDKQ